MKYHNKVILVDADGVLLNWEYAFCCCGGDGVYVLDVRNPPNFPVIGFYDTASSPSGLAVQGDQCYVADSGDGLYVLGMLVSATEVTQFGEVQSQFQLENHPDPFNPLTNITFVLERSQRIKVSLFDLKGREVAVVIERSLSEGFHEVQWNGRDYSGRALSSGNYLVKIKGEDGMETEKITVVR